jgi:hypothetical protein
VLGNTPAPSTSIDACLWDGFHLNSGVKISGGSGVLLVAGEAFTWKPWEASSGEKKLSMVNEKGQFEVADDAWGLLELVWPKPGTLPMSFLRRSTIPGGLRLSFVLTGEPRFINSWTGKGYEANKSEDERTD